MPALTLNILNLSLRIQIWSILSVQVSVSNNSTSKVATLHQCCIAHQLMSNTYTPLNMQTKCCKYVNHCERDQWTQAKPAVMLECKTGQELSL